MGPDTKSCVSEDVAPVDVLCQIVHPKRCTPKTLHPKTLYHKTLKPKKLHPQNPSPQNASPKNASPQNALSQNPSPENSSPEIDTAFYFPKIKMNPIAQSCLPQSFPVYSSGLNERQDISMFHGAQRRPRGPRQGVAGPQAPTTPLR